MTTKYTAVQHSGYGYAGKKGFKQGLEPRAVATVAEQRRVEKAGGILFDDYAEADLFCDKAMGLDDPGPGLYPNAQGTFADLKVDGLAVYIPVRKVVG